MPTLGETGPGGDVRHGRRLDVGDAMLLGAAAGIAGGVAMILARPLEARGYLPPSRRDAPEWERLVRSVAARRKIRVSRRQVRLLGTVAQLVYSALIGAGYGAVRARARIPPALRGTVTGALAYAAGYPRWGIVPRIGAARPALGRAPRRALIPVGTHALFGLVVAEVFKLLARGRLT